jgi:hypothetical protein
LYKQGGWDRVSKAFTELPQSTEQILHPEKYFAHEAPVKVTLPDITLFLNGRDQKSEVRGQSSEVSRFVGSANLRTVSGYAFTGSASGAPPAFERYSSLITHHSTLSSPVPDTRYPAPAASWHHLDYDIQGEWGFYLILDQFLKSPAESRRAAAGWGGDRFAVYESPKGESCFISLSVWDTENDAREFFDAYVKRTELRYPGATSLSPTIRTELHRSWRTNEGTVTIDLLHGSRVLILEGTPDRFDLNSIQKLMQ